MGYVVSEEGVQTVFKKIEVVKKRDRPHSVYTVRVFLDFMNYYGKFIKDYSKIARPQYDLISGYNKKKGTNPVE